MSDQVREIELNIKEAKKLVDLGEAVERLKSNRDFRKLVLDGYLKDEAVRLVHLKADPNFQTPQMQASITKDIDAIGSLSAYFTTVAFNARQAESAIKSSEEELEEIAQEELSNG